MVGVTVSAPLDLIQKIRDKAMSPSRVFQLGLEVAIAGGGVESVRKMKTDLREALGKLDMKQMHNEELIVKIAKIETELAVYKERLADNRKTVKEEEKEIASKYGITAD